MDKLLEICAMTASLKYSPELAPNPALIPLDPLRHTKCTTSAIKTRATPQEQRHNGNATSATPEEQRHKCNIGELTDPSAKGAPLYQLGATPREPFRPATEGQRPDSSPH
jgi:hypothetical protein